MDFCILKQSEFMRAPQGSIFYVSISDIVEMGPSYAIHESTLTHRYPTIWILGQAFEHDLEDHQYPYGTAIVNEDQEVALEKVGNKWRALTVIRQTRKMCKNMFLQSDTHMYVPIVLAQAVKVCELTTMTSVPYHLDILHTLVHFPKDLLAIVSQYLFTYRIPVRNLIVGPDKTVYVPKYEPIEIGGLEDKCWALITYSYGAFRVRIEEKTQLYQHYQDPSLPFVFPCEIEVE
jgi:hypothetical protein